MNNTLHKLSFSYIFNFKKDKAFSVSTILSSLALILGISILITVMSVMNGFREQLVDSLSGVPSLAPALRRSAAPPAATLSGPRIGVALILAVFHCLGFCGASSSAPIMCFSPPALFSPPLSCWSCS